MFCFELGVAAQILKRFTIEFTDISRRRGAKSEAGSIRARRPSAAPDNWRRDDADEDAHRPSKAPATHRPLQLRQVAPPPVAADTRKDVRAATDWSTLLAQY